MASTSCKISTKKMTQANQYRAVHLLVAVFSRSARAIWLAFAFTNFDTRTVVQKLPFFLLEGADVFLFCIISFGVSFEDPFASEQGCKNYDDIRVASRMSQRRGATTNGGKRTKTNE